MKNLNQLSSNYEYLIIHFIDFFINLYLLFIIYHHNIILLYKNRLLNSIIVLLVIQIKKIMNIITGIKELDEYPATS